MTVDFAGVGSTVILYGKNKYLSSNIILRNNTTIVLNESKYLIKSLKIQARSANGICVYIGRNFSCFGCVFKLAESNNCYIGDDCQFSYGIYIWNSDGHAILDENAKCINYGKPVFIGNHVWVGHNVEILKGSVILDNSIVGAGSVITKKFDEKGIVIAGNPASIIKRNVNWDRRLPTDFCGT